MQAAGSQPALRWSTTHRCTAVLLQVPPWRHCWNVFAFLAIDLKLTGVHVALRKDHGGTATASAPSTVTRLPGRIGAAVAAVLVSGLAIASLCFLPVLSCLAGLLWCVVAALAWVGRKWLLRQAFHSLNVHILGLHVQYTTLSAGDVPGADSHTTAGFFITDIQSCTLRDTQWLPPPPQPSAISGSKQIDVSGLLAYVSPGACRFTAELGSVSCVT